MSNGLKRLTHRLMSVAEDSFAHVKSFFVGLNCRVHGVRGVRLPVSMSVPFFVAARVKN